MSVSKEDVLWCYRAILGREPESNEVVESKIHTHGDFSSLRNSFITSDEFQISTNGRSYRSATDLFPLGHPSIEIEHQATTEQLAQCLTHIKAAWSHLGITRPHHSVLTSESFLPESLEGNIDVFWKSGEEEAKQVDMMLKRHGFDFKGKTCVEYGCGVGRVTMGLAHGFSEVNAYDISANHLSIAAKRAKSLEVTNIKFHLCAQDMLRKLQPCDFFYSRIVFQHNPPPVIAKLVENALTSLKDGGIAIFQIPTYQTGYRFSLSEWLGNSHVLDMQMHCLPQHVIFSIIKTCGCDLLEVREDNNAGIEFISNSFIVQKKHKSRTAKFFPRSASKILMNFKSIINDRKN